MYKNEDFLVPVIPELPPTHHTEIMVRCFTCKKFPVCNIRTDYLKTAQLISNILGEPNEDLEMVKEPPYLPCFCGNIIENANLYFPEEITTITGLKGTFYKAKFTDSNHVKFVYSFEPYYVIFTAIYNEETSLFDISKGVEPFYKVEYQIADELIDDIKLGLMTFKEDEDKKEPEPEPDVINTTAFSARLECKFYEGIKGLKYEDGIRRLIAKYPCGIPLGDDVFYHLATFHIEPYKVNCYNPNHNKVGFMPMPYPVFIPPKKKHHLTRDEVNET